MSKADALARIRAKARIKHAKRTDDRTARLPRPGEVNEQKHAPLAAEIPQALDEIIPPEIATAIREHFPGRVLEIRSTPHGERER